MRFKRPPFSFCPFFRSKRPGKKVNLTRGAVPFHVLYLSKFYIPKIFLFFVESVYSHKFSRDSGNFQPEGVLKTAARLRFDPRNRGWPFLPLTPDCLVLSPYFIGAITLLRSCPYPLPLSFSLLLSWCFCSYLDMTYFLYPFNPFLVSYHPDTSQ